MKQDANAVTLEYVNRWGDHHTLALYRDSYAMGGGFAISALDATDPADSEYLSPWSDITVNIPDNPDAAWWCATEGNVIIDTNNNSKEQVESYKAEKAAAREEREDGLTATAKASRDASQALAGDPWSEWQAPEPAL